MRIVLFGLGGLLALVIILFGLQLAASERVEVVELHTVADNGEEKTTRLWIVDHQGRQYLRAGGDPGWYLRAIANKEVSLTRGELTKRYEVVPKPGLRVPVNEAMQAKYTWGNTLISYLVGGRDESVPVELVPVD